MHPRVIWAIVRKDFLDIWLNKSTLAGLIFPIFLSLMWLLISRVIGGRTTEILIYNPDNSVLAQVITQAFPGAKITQASSAVEVQAAFGPDGAKVKSPYTLGLVIPANFDDSLRAETIPAISLFLNGATISAQAGGAEGLLQTAIINYARAVASPQPPVTINTTTINPPSTTNTAAILGQVYTPLALLLSLMVGTTFIPQLLLEEKERKTLRMLLVTPASFGDILAGKLLVVLVFQLATTSVALAILGGLAGEVPLVLLYVFLSACFSLSLGLLFGSVFNSSTTAGTVAGVVSTIYILGGIFVGPLGQLMSNSPVLKVAKLLPTYYLAEGVVNASQRLGTWSSNLLDIGIILGSIIILLVISAWALRRQSAVEATI